MTNGNDVARAKYLESAAMNVKRYVLGEILDLSQAIVNDIASLTSNDFILDTVASTVDGGMWYETTATAPIVKLYQGGSTYYLYTNQLVSPNLSLSSSAVTVTTGAAQNVTLSHSGNGTVTLSNPDTSALTASYDSSNNVIALSSNVTRGAADVTVNLGVALSEAGTYAADSKTLAITCTNPLVSPNLSLSSSTVTVNNSASQTVTLSYSGNGTITLSNPNTTALTASYNSSTKTITLTSNLTAGDDPVSVNLGVALSEAGTYAADSQTLAVTCQGGLLNPQLTITPSETSVAETVTATVSYLGTGTISVTPSNDWHSDYSYDANTHTITITYSAKSVDIFDGEEFTVSLSAADGYDAATATLTLTS